MAKTLSLKLSPQIIVDFQSCFDTIQEERKHLYDNATQQINQGTGDIFIKKSLNLRTVVNGTPVNTPSTLDEINFEKSEIPSHPQWETKDIGGKLESYEYIIGDTFWRKLNQWAKLNYILNKKYNVSLLDDKHNILEKAKADGKMPESQIKLQEEQQVKMEKELNKSMEEECMEAYVYKLFGTIIIDKIKALEQKLLNEEFAELNKPAKPLTK